MRWITRENIKVEDFSLGDEALQRLGQIVRAADVKGQEHIAPEGLGLRAIAQGFAELGLSDDERLRVGDLGVQFVVVALVPGDWLACAHSTRA